MDSHTRNRRDAFDCRIKATILVHVSIIPWTVMVTCIHTVTPCLWLKCTSLTGISRRGSRHLELWRLYKYHDYRTYRLHRRESLTPPWFSSDSKSSLYVHARAEIQFLLTGLWRTNRNEGSGSIVTLPRLRQFVPSRGLRVTAHSDSIIHTY